MFESATIRLSLVYLAILAVVCLFFSYNWYNVATSELDRGISQTQELLQRQTPRFGSPFINQLLQEREDQLRDSKRVILARILLVDIFILALGAGGGYVLARRTLQPIKDAHEAQARFSSDASHELRTPLTAIRTQTEVALMDEKLPPEIQDLLHNIVEEVNTMTTMTDKLLLLARRRESVTTKNQAIHRSIERALFSVRPIADNKHITLTYKKSAVTATTNNEILQHIILILLQNAVKYSPEHSRVSVRTRKDRHRVFVSVRDMGEGIAPADQSRIFERFYRADTSRSKASGGYGLGLAIAKQLVQSINAELTVKSSTGRGSTFTVVLPV